MSPRAAWRLERLGYGPVYDYAAGKVDWMAAGLSTIRADSSQPRALDVADRAPPTCRPDQPVSEVVGSAPPRTLIVINDEGIVLGWFRAGASAGEGTARVEDVMEPGPATVRANEPLPPLLERMAGRQVNEIIVTTPEGRLLGVVRRPEEEHGHVVA